MDYKTYLEPKTHEITKPINRKEMIKKHGLKWAFQYSGDQWYNEEGISQQQEYNLTELK